MSGVLLFCIAEEAKAFVRTVLDIKLITGDDESKGSRMFYLVESRNGPIDDEQRLRQELGPDETFQTDFVGASVEDCQKWALQQQEQHLFIERDLIAVVDARSAKDHTILTSFFNAAVDEPLDFGRYGFLPEKGDTWYDFRTNYKLAVELETQLSYGAVDGVYPVCFGLKQELTDKHGVFDAERALSLIEGAESTVLEC
ncbi:MAG: hypothetical protein Q9227_000500 [Pyrenula ochraceoflavens]